MYKADSFTRVLLDVDINQRFDDIRPNIVNVAMARDNFHPIEVTARGVKNSFDREIPKKTRKMLSKIFGVSNSRTEAAGAFAATPKVGIEDRCKAILNIG
jgi:hypothetical protein